MEYTAQAIDVAVIGAGHAGVEAALACARLGVRVALFSMSLDAIANLPCNPSIGGTAKGHLVRELDALGGEMGKAADAVFLQSRMLNRGKGPAVHSLRVQADRAKYHLYMKSVLERQPGLLIKQAEIIDIRLDRDGHVGAVVTHLGAVYPCKAAIICTGTFLGGKIFVGEESHQSGPDGMHASIKLGKNLERIGVKLRRFKTGTPARVHKDSIDFSKLEGQEGDDPVVPFSFSTKHKLTNKLVCHIAYTNEDTHRVIRENLHRSPLYGGQIEGVGPRYCPSIEDKVVRFAQKPRHQIFVEPMGIDTNEMYLQGLSSSLPEEVQIQLYRTVSGFEKIEIMRNAYAIEYDCTDSLDLLPTLEFINIKGLFGAGQFNGTSGYEEAAVQGFVAGVNAAHKILNRPAFILERSGSYIGTLIDDLVTKGCLDPYRMMTSRSEYRLLLRQDNADERLTAIGREIKLVGDEQWEMFHVKQSEIKQELERISKVVVAPSEELNALLEKQETAPITTGVKLRDLIRRPQVGYKDLAEFDPGRPELSPEVCERVEIEIKYEGYIGKQLLQVEQMRRLEKTILPPDLDYQNIRSLRLEAREKLSRVRPLNVGQAGRVSGVSPADIAVLLIYLEQRKSGEKAEQAQ